MAKKTLKKRDVINRNKSEYDDNLTKIIIILGIVLAMFVTIYIGTALVRGEWKSKDEEEKKEVTIQTEEILAGSTFKITDKEYIVLYYSFKGNDAGLFDMLYSGYSTSSSVKIYKVNLDSGFNKKYVSDKNVNSKPSKISDLKVKDPTLIRIKDKKVVKFISSKSEIQKYLNN